MKQNNPTFNVYTRSKLTVRFTQPAQLSHLLNCYCKTINHPTERAFILKKVNFYKFKAYVENTLKQNWQDWYSATRYTSIYMDILADFINESEHRDRIWKQEINLSAKLDSLIAQAIQLKADTQNWLATH